MNSPSRREVLDPVQFLAYVAAVLQIPAISMEVRLYEDLALDSLGIYELLVAVEDLGVELPEAEWVSSATVGDCYRTYRDATARLAES